MENKEKVSITFMILGIVFTSCLIVSNILAFKVISIGPFTATTAMFLFPISYILNDVITEVWGFSKARILIWCGFGVNFLSILFFQMAIEAPASEFWPHQEAFQTVLGSTLRIAASSLCGFLAGSFTNSLIMSKMKVASQGRHFFQRAMVSTIFGEFSDSLFFFTLCFAFILPFTEIVKMIFFQTAAKTLFEAFVLPFTRIIVKKIKKAEQLDTFDNNKDYKIIAF